MKNIQDKQFERLNHAVSLSKQSKEKMKNTIMRKSPKPKSYLFPKALSVIVTIFTIVFVYTLLSNHGTEDVAQGIITDSQTTVNLPEIEVSHDMFTIEWRSDSMDRGSHDLKIDDHGELVISEDINSIERGEIIYYQTQQEEQIGRVVGLPGEKVEIREGDVYIDDKRLQTFYGTATSLGLTRDEYFARVPAENVNQAGMEEYFATSMDPVIVEENTVFVLVDMWWRGIDSRELGLIANEQVVGKVLGYEK